MDKNVKIRENMEFLTLILTGSIRIEGVKKENEYTGSCQ